MPASTTVAKKKQPSEGSTPQFYATRAYKQWARAKWDETGWSLKEFARRIKRINPNANATDGSLGLFFGSKDEPAAPSNTTLMPEINKLFGAPPPPICDPTSPLSRLHDQLEARWSKLTPSGQRALLALLGDDAE